MTVSRMTASLQDIIKSTQGSREEDSASGSLHTECLSKGQSTDAAVPKSFSVSRYYMLTTHHSPPSPLPVLQQHRGKPEVITPKGTSAQQTCLSQPEPPPTFWRSPLCTALCLQGCLGLDRLLSAISLLECLSLCLTHCPLLGHRDQDLALNASGLH